MLGVCVCLVCAGVLACVLHSKHVLLRCDHACVRSTSSHSYTIDPKGRRCWGGGIKKRTLQNNVEPGEIIR